jgi:hypothetical protein
VERSGLKNIFHNHPLHLHDCNKHFGQSLFALFDILPTPTVIIGLAESFVMICISTPQTPGGKVRIETSCLSFQNILRLNEKGKASVDPAFGFFLRRKSISLSAAKLSWVWE